MNNKQILRKALEKAEMNGFVLKDDKHMIAVDYSGVKPMLGYESIIFSHDFAKAFWGEGLRPILCSKCGNSDGDMDWQYYLQKMALEEDRLKYLEKFLD